VFVRRNLITILLSIEIMLKRGEPDLCRSGARWAPRRPDHRVFRDDRRRRRSPAVVSRSSSASSGIASRSPDSFVSLKW